MRFVVRTNDNINNTLILQVEHEDQIIHFDINCYDRKPFIEFDICKELNEYLATFTYSQQDILFNYYNQMKDIFLNGIDYYNLLRDISPIISNLYNEFDFEKVLYWVNLKSNIIIPDLKNEYVHDALKATTREKTYLKEDYQKLIALTLLLKLMIPIWGEFIYITKKETGTDYKEFTAFKLLNNANILDLEPITKLRHYISQNIKKDDPLLHTIVSGPGSEEYPDYLLALVIIRRICIANISGVSHGEEATTLIANIYNFITQKIANANMREFKHIVKQKEYKQTGKDDADNASRFEDCKIKEQHSYGNHAMHAVFTDKPLHTLSFLDKNIDMELYNLLINSITDISNHRISLFQQILTQYILASVFSIKSLNNVSKILMVNCIIITQYSLWKKGYYMLAAMMTAVPHYTSNLLNVNSKTRINKETIDLIEAIFPYNIVGRNRLKTKPINPIIRVIEDIEKMLSEHEWIITLPIELNAAQYGIQRRMMCPSDTKQQLANLILQLAKEREEYVALGN